MANHESGNDCTRLPASETRGLGPLEFRHPPETFALTPASHVALEAVANQQKCLAGIGIDWGCGAGCLAIAAARVAAVERVFGLDIAAANVDVAGSNAVLNGVAHKTVFMVSDSYSPAADVDRGVLDSYAGRVNFILANPPASNGDDGFGFRRTVLEGARRFLTAGGFVFLNISYQYGAARIERLLKDVPGFRLGGLIASTDWVPFDLRRPDLLRNLEDYAAEEVQGGFDYSFRHPGSPGDDIINARTAQSIFNRNGLSPLSKWQTHLFEFAP